MKEKVKLIEKDDSLFHEQTSTKSYDSHHYKIVCKDQFFVVQSWQEVQEWLWNNCNSPTFDAVVHVLDKPKPKSKGFK